MVARGLGAAGQLRHAVAADGEQLDVRSLCITREVLERHHDLADFAFTMQGLGSGPISLFGNAEQRTRYLPGVASDQAWISNAGRLLAEYVH